MGNFINDLLQSPPWVIATFVVVYTLALVFVVWKISGWYMGLAGWNKQRVSEKTWKEKVARLEKENLELQEKLKKNSSPSEKEKK